MVCRTIENGIGYNKNGYGINCVEYKRMSGKTVKVIVTDDYGYEVERIYKNVTDKTIEKVEWSILMFLTVHLMFVKEEKKKNTQSIWEQEIIVSVNT